uniref:FAT domain-containing protein n=1 Tax=Macrostomum lignano TaxID=282301 RepID=A0A1I8J6V9_9PLAT
MITDFYSKHRDCQYHAQACDAFQKVLQQEESGDISAQLKTTAHAALQDNRYIFKAVLHAIEYLGRTNQGLRSHREDVGRLRLPDAPELRFCPTRFIDGLDSVFNFLELFDAAVEYFNDADQSVYNNIVNPVTIVALHVLQALLGAIRGLAVVLQGKAMDLIAASEEADRILRLLKAWRSDCEDAKFKEVFAAAEELHKKHHGDQPIPDKYRASASHRSQHRSNAQGASVSDTFKLNIWYPALDLIIIELSECFSKSAKVAMQMAKLLPAFCAGPDSAESTLAAAKAFEEYAAFLDMPAVCLAEFERWQAFCCDLPETERNDMTISQAIKRCNPSLWPNVCKLLTIFLTTPVTTCTAE